MAGKLTAAGLRGLVKPGAYADGEGLYLRVRGPDARAWAFRWKRAGKQHWQGLGAFPAVSLAEAREAAAEARKALAAECAAGRPVPRGHPLRASLANRTDRYAAGRA